MKAENVSLQKSISENKNYSQNLYENLVFGNITATEYKAMKAEYDERIQHTLSVISELAEKQKQYATEIERCADLAETAKAVNESTVLTGELVNKLINRITLDSERKVRVELAFESGFSNVTSLEAVANG